MSTSAATEEIGAQKCSGLLAAIGEFCGNCQSRTNLVIDSNVDSRKDSSKDSTRAFGEFVRGRVRSLTTWVLAFRMQSSHLVM